MTLQEQIAPYLNHYAPSLIEEFIDYWEETNAKGKQKWQLEKTWEISRRLKRWQRQQAKWDWEKEQRNKLKLVNERPVQREVVIERKDTGFKSLFE